MKHEDRLVALEQRIERLSTDPEHVGTLFTRLVRPILKGLGWRPALITDATSALLRALATSTDDLDEPIDRAVDELEDNVASIERACVVNGRVATAHAAWLRRLFEVVVRAAHAAGTTSPIDRRIASSIDPSRVLPPLTVRAAESDDETTAEEPAADPLVELQLAAIDHLLDAARDERAFLARRRRLLEAARQMLLESAAALPLEQSAVEARRTHIAKEIVRIDRLQSAGVDPNVGLLHQARAALSRGDRSRLHATIVALDERATAAGDAMFARRTRAALDRLRAGAVRPLESVDRSAREALGAPVVEQLAKGIARAREPLDAAEKAQGLRGDASSLEKSNEELLFQQLAASIAVDGAFEVGGALSPVRVVEVEERARTVAWPTADLQLVPARTIEDIATGIIEDPRTILLSLATGRMLTRKYVEIERIERKRTKLIGEVRVYVLDGSGSMLGPRSRVRDGLLIAELATMLQRLEAHSRSVRVTLFYRYFDTALGPVTRVHDRATALAALGDVAGSVRTGGTDIETAVVASLRQVHDARAHDPDLSRAQIVLVTDGQSEVRQEVVENARKGLEDMSIALSVIALGEENLALRNIVAAQRARGERAFYHFVPDPALAEIVRGEVDRGDPLHLLELAEDKKQDAATVATVLGAELGSLLDELVDLDRRRDLEAIERAEAELRAASELGIELDGAAARRAALARDVSAVESRYARWFPTPESAKRTEEGDDDDATYVVLATVAEVVSVVGGATLTRRAEAIETLERILSDAGLSPSRYQRTVRDPSPRVREGLLAVHASVSPRP